MNEPSNEQELIKLDRVSFSYDETPILKNISLSIFPGKILGIVGPNGGGKSTLLKIIAGLLNISEGSIKVNNEQLVGELYDTINIAYVPQRDDVPCVLPLKVTDVIKLGNNKISKKGLEEILGLFDIIKERNQSYNKLSGGQQQRVLLAKALAQSPRLLILDEPTKGLDSLGQDQLLMLMKNIIKDSPETSIVIVDHNLNQVIKNSDSILCLNRTHHWHDKKELLSQDVINSVYHCEFEHTKIHESHIHGELPPHHHCDLDGHQHKHHHKDEGDDS